MKGLNLKFKYKVKINNLQAVKNNRNKMNFKVISKGILEKKSNKIVKFQR